MGTQARRPFAFSPLGLSTLLKRGAGAYPIGMKVHRPLSFVLALAVALGAPGPGAYAASAKIAAIPAKPSLWRPALSLNAGLPRALARPLPTSAAAAAVPAAKTAPAGPIAAKPQLENAAQPFKDNKDSLENKTESDKRWDASAAKKSDAPEPVLLLNPSAAKPSYLKVGRRQRDHVVSRLGAVAPPQVLKAKAVAAASWLALIGAGIALHYPFHRPAPMVIAVILSPAISFFWIIFKGSGAHFNRPGDKIKPLGKNQRVLKEFHTRVKTIAASAGVREPDEIKILPYGKHVQAYADGGTRGYILGASQALLAQPKDIQEAVLRHEFAHVRHHDGYFLMAQALLAPIGPMLALVSNAPDGSPWATGLGAAAMILGLSAAQKHDEYQADQAAAAGMGGPAGLVRYFLRDSQDKRAALAAAEGKIYPRLGGWRRAGALSWLWLKSALDSHPPHLLRIARLARLSKK